MGSSPTTAWPRRSSSTAGGGSPATKSLARSTSWRRCPATRTASSTGESCAIPTGWGGGGPSERRSGTGQASAGRSGSAESRKSVSALRPRRRVSRPRTSAGATFPRLTSRPRRRMSQTCCSFRGASNTTGPGPDAEITASTTSSRTLPSSRYSPTLPCSRPSSTIQRAPASRSARACRARSAGEQVTRGSFEPTSDSTTKRPAARAISLRFSVAVMAVAPLEISTAGKPIASAQARKSPILPRSQAISARVPPGQASTWWRARMASLSPRSRSRYEVPQPNFQMSAKRAMEATRGSKFASGTPRSRTWVRPTGRGLGARAGRPRNPASSPAVRPSRSGSGRNRPADGGPDVPSGGGLTPHPRGRASLAGSRPTSRPFLRFGGPGPAGPPHHLVHHLGGGPHVDPGDQPLHLPVQVGAEGVGLAERRLQREPAPAALPQRVLEQLLRPVLAQPRRQDGEHALRGQIPLVPGQVLPHPRLVHLQSLQHRPGEVQRRAGVEAGVGEGRPLRLPAGPVALVLLHHALQHHRSLRPHQATQRHQVLGHLRIPLVGHGDAADRLRARGLAQLPDLGPL